MMRVKYTSVMFRTLFGVFCSVLLNLIFLSDYAFLRAKPVLCWDHDYNTDQGKPNFMEKSQFTSIMLRQWIM